MTKKTTDFWLLMVLITTLLIAGCTPAATEAPPEPTKPQVPTDPEPTQVSEPTTLPEPAAPPAPTAAPAPEPIVLTDGLGTTISFEIPFQRVVSLAPSNTEILFAVGSGSQVVGRDSFSDFPEAALALPDIGGGFTVLDTETILSLDPDLVLAADLTPPEQIQSLTDLGLTVFALPNPVELTGMYDNLRTVAQLTGHETKTETLIETLITRVTFVETAMAGLETRPLVFYELDGTDPNAPWTSGPGTFIDSLISMAGGDNLGAVLEGAWAQISVEELIAQDPDIILLGDFIWGGVTPEDVAARGGWEALAAVENGQVFPFDDNLVSRPGPRLVDGLEALAQLLHPDRFDN